MSHMQVGRYIVGTGFCIIAALIYCVNYAAAAASAHDLTQWHTDLGRVGTAVQQDSSGFLTTLAVVALLIGIAFIVAAELTRRR